MARPIVPIQNLSRRLPEAGRLRFGVKTARAMKAIDTWRATSHDEEAIRQLAAIYGGAPKPWADAPTPGQWEVITNTSELRVVLPPDCLGGTPIYEQWTGGGCSRRCDGITCDIVVKGNDGAETQQVECICSAKGEMACEPHLRLSVILPEVRFGGVWRMDTKSWNAVAELPGMVDLISSLQDRGLTRGVLALKHRRSVTGGETHRFIVPVLGVDETVEALAAGAARLGALPSGNGAVAAIGTGSEGGGDDDVVEDRAAEEVEPVGSPPVPAGETSTDVTDAIVVPDRAVLVKRLQSLPTKAANTARRRAHEARLGSIDDGEPTADDLEGWDVILNLVESEAGEPEPVSEPQLKKLNTVLQLQGHVGPMRHTFATQHLGREIASLKDLSSVEASRLIDVLKGASS